MAQIKKGSQTPTKSVVIPYKVTKGKEAIEQYQKTGRRAQKWQANMIMDIMARNEDNLWTHTKFGFAVPRRSGKNEVVIIRELWGLVNGEYIIHTAHRTKTSHAAWERVIKMLDLCKIKYKSIRAEGRENITLDKGGKIDFRTRSAKGGLGEGCDLLIIDEAQEYTDDQESALKYIVSDSKNPQTIFCGTPPTPVSSGTVFTKLREKTLQGGRENTAWWEWSVDEQQDPRDRKWWYKTNPSLGTILTERDIVDEIGDDPIDFNIQRLGLWIRYNQKSAISKIEWEELKARALPNLKGKLTVGIKYGYDGTNVAMSVAAKTTSGKNFVEVIDCRNRRSGNGWIISFLKNADVGAVVIDGASGQGLLEEEMKNEGLKKPILPTVKEIIKANNVFELALSSGAICHMGQPSLTQAVSNCEKRAIGHNGGFGYQSLHDGIEIALLDSVILANWYLGEQKPKGSNA